MTRLLSTRELADAIGVSESSIKRWADDGTLRAARTAGGHRRIPLPEAIRFVRSSGAPLARPEILGLPELPVAPAASGAGEVLYGLLEAGRGAEARGLLLSLYLAGESVAAIVDGTVQPAMERLGDLWRHDPAGILVEHRATDLCIQALQHLRAMLPAEPSAPVALGGAPEDDPYVIPSLAAAASLAGEGFAAVNLGAMTPFATLRRGVEDTGPLLVWVSASSVGDPARFARELVRFARELAGSTPVVAGGRALAGVRLPATANLQRAQTMTELVAFARGLAGGAPRPGPPG